MAKSKIEPVTSIKINAYEVITRAVEEGVKFGWNHAHKHNNNPDVEEIQDHIVYDVMHALSEVIDFNFPED